MGEDHFRNGIVSYLKAFQFGNAETSDLWCYLAQFSQDGVNLPRVMGTWTKQMGYPVINVKRQGNTLVVTQSRFLSNKEETYDPTESIYG